MTPKRMNNFISMTVDVNRNWSPAKVKKVRGNGKITNQYMLEAHRQITAPYILYWQWTYFPPRRSGNIAQINYNKKGRWKNYTKNVTNIHQQ